MNVLELLSRGIPQAANAIERRNYMLTRYAMLIALAANVLLTSGFLVALSDLTAPPVVIMMLGTVAYVACTVLMMRSHHQLGRLLFSTALVFVVSGLSMSLGPDCGTQMLFFAIGIGASIVWPAHLLAQRVLVLVCLSLFLVMEFSSSVVGSITIDIAVNVQRELWLFHTVLAFVIGVVVVHLTNQTSAELQTQLDIERQKADALLHNVLPSPVVHELKRERQFTARRLPAVTVVFADISGFTAITDQFDAERVLSLLNQLFSAFDKLAEAHELEKIKTIGDAYMVVAGAPVARDDHVAAACDLALDMRDATAAFTLPDGSNLQVRIGIDTGPAIGGVVGSRRYIYDVWGNAVNTASRMESHGAPGRIHVTERVQAALKDSHRFTTRGRVAIKSMGTLHTWWLEERRPCVHRATESMLPK